MFSAIQQAPQILKQEHCKTIMQLHAQCSGDNRRRKQKKAKFPQHPKERKKMQLPKKQGLLSKRRVFISKRHIPGHSNQWNKRRNLCRLNSLDIKRARFGNHKASFNLEIKRNATELSKPIWNLKENNLNYAITWKILYRAPCYSNKTKRCPLCKAEKFYIICYPKAATLLLVEEPRYLLPCA